MRRPDRSIRAVSSICSTQTTMSLFVSRLAWIAAPRVHGTPPCNSACADYAASTDRPITLGVCPSDKPNSKDSITRLRRSQLIGGLRCPQQFACRCQLIRSACLSRHDFLPVRITAISLPRACRERRPHFDHEAGDFPRAIQAYPEAACTSATPPTCLAAISPVDRRVRTRCSRQGWGRKRLSRARRAV